MPTNLCREQRRYCRDGLRTARLAALADSEAAGGLFHAIEWLGLLLREEAGTLKNYRPKIQDFVSSNLGQLPADFEQLYEHVHLARNDAQHHGAFARTLVSHATRLALHLEDALLSKEMNSIDDYAITNPVCAEFWHPIAFCRQQMLENSFSALPLFDRGELVPRHIQWLGYQPQRGP